MKTLPLFALLLAACAHQPPPDGSGLIAAFFFGLVHGLMAPINLIAGLFLSVRIYEFPNGGWFYDLGFLIGLIVFASTHATRRRSFRLAKIIATMPRSAAMIAMPAIS